MNSSQNNFAETSIKMDHQHLCHCFLQMIWQPLEGPHCNSVVNMRNSSHGSNPNSWRFGIPFPSEYNEQEVFSSWNHPFLVPTKLGQWVCTLNSNKSTVWPPERTFPLCGFGHLRVVLHRPLHGWIFRRGQVPKGIEAHRSWHSDEVHVAVGFKFKIR